MLITHEGAKVATPTHNGIRIVGQTLVRQLEEVVEYSI